MLNDVLTDIVSTPRPRYTSVEAFTPVCFEDIDTRTSKLARPAFLEMENPIPHREFYITHRFPSGDIDVILVELYEEDNWVASLRSDRSIFSDGDSPEEAVQNLLASAEEDLEILAEYGERVTSYLRRKRNLLRSLFA